MEQVALLLKRLKIKRNVTWIVTPLRLNIRVIMLADFMAWISSIWQWKPIERYI